MDPAAASRTNHQAMNVLLTDTSSFDLGNEDCDSRSYAADELLEPTFATQQPPPIAKRTSRRTSLKKQQQHQKQQKHQPVSSKRRGSSSNKKSPSAFAASCGSSAASAGMDGYTKRDILSGRGGLANKHFGNKVFRRLIKHNKDLYRRLKSKVKQELLIRSILLAVASQGGRFLKEDRDTGMWYQIEEKEAWNKTCQALREPDRGGGSKASDGSEVGSDDGTAANDGGSQGSVMSSSSTMGEPPRHLVPPPQQQQQQQQQQHNIERQSSAAATFAPSVTALSPLARIRRQYTSDDPPSADRRIFDQAMADGAEPQQLMRYDEDDVDVDAAAIAPALLEMQTSMGSLSGFAFGGERARRSFTYHQQQHQPNDSEALHGFQGFGASYYQDYYNSNNQPHAHGGFGGMAYATPPPQHQFLRSDPTSLPSHPMAHGTPSQHSLMGPASSPSFPPPPPPPPFFRSTSSATFYRGLEEVTALDRQESTASFDCFSFANGGGAAASSAPV